MSVSSEKASVARQHEHDLELLDGQEPAAEDDLGFDAHSMASRLFVAPWRIRFKEPIESEFRNSYHRASLRRIRISVTLAIMLFGGFILLDAATLQQTITSRGLFLYFLIIIPALSSLFVASYIEAARTRISSLIGVVIFIVGLAVYGLIIEARTAGHLFPSESLLLVTLFAYFLSGMLLHQAMLVGFGLCLIYSWCELFIGLPRYPGYYDLYYLFAANGLGYAGCFFFEYTLRREYRSMRALNRLATRDELTGLRNRRRFERHFGRVWRHAIREEKSLVLMIMDVDFFKAYNDQYGHPAGDACLRKVAEAIEAEIHRPMDMVARYGGEEFAVLWFNVAPDVVEGLVDRMLLAVQGVNLPHAGSWVSDRVTISIGAAVTQPDRDSDMSEFFETADAALYEAKESGRNCGRVTHWPEEACEDTVFLGNTTQTK